MEILSLVFFTFIASVIGTTTSFGTSTIMVPVLGMFYPLGVTLLFTGIIHWFGNLWKIWFFRSGLQIKLILLFGIPGIVASYMGGQMVLGIGETTLNRLLGAFLLLYVLFLVLNREWEITTTPTSAVIGGLSSGFTAGIFGVGGAVRAAFLSAYKLNKDVFICTAGAIGLFIDSGRIISYTVEGIRLSQELIIALAVAIPVSYLGGYVGKKISDKVPQQSFRYVIATALFLIAITYLI